MQSYELCADMIDVVIDVSCIYGAAAAAQAADRLEVCSPPPCLASGLGEGADDGTGSTASNCVITLNNGTALFLREMNRSLALVRLRREPLLAPLAPPRAARAPLLRRSASSRSL